MKAWLGGGGSPRDGVWEGRLRSAFWPQSSPVSQPVIRCWCWPEHHAAPIPDTFSLGGKEEERIIHHLDGAPPRARQPAFRLTATHTHTHSLTTREKCARMCSESWRGEARSVRVRARLGVRMMERRAGRRGEMLLLALIAARASDLVCPPSCWTGGIFCCDIMRKASMI